MALLPVYTAAASPTTSTEWTTAVIQDTAMNSWFVPSRQAFYTANTNHTYIMYYDGTGVRLGRGFGGGGSSLSHYDRDKGIPLLYSDLASSAPVGMRHEMDPTSFMVNWSKESVWSDRTNMSNFSVLYDGYAYLWNGGGSPKYIQKINITTGTMVEQYNFTISGLSNLFDADGIWFSADGNYMYITDKSRGELRIWNRRSNTFVTEWYYDAAYRLSYDHTRDLLWTVRASDTKVVVYMMQPAPASITLSLGSNRARYKQDALSALVLGSNSEPVPNWPVAWSLTGGSQGTLATLYSLTDSTGTATNTYYGPGDNDYTGASQTIEATTGY